MGKNQASAVYISTTQGYGHLMPIQQWPELTAPVGQAMGAMAKQQGVYFRNYTKGLAIVNPTNVSATVDLDPSYDYTDCYRAKVTATRSETPLFAPFLYTISKLITLPRQAWDKHRVNSKTTTVFILGM